MAGFLAELGRKILRNGYNVIPIKPGAKYPVIPNWQKTITTPAMIHRWLTNGHAEAGVGIVTGKVVFIDCDTPDKDDALHMEEFCKTKFGLAPVRIGNYPKRGLLYRVEGDPFRKITSKTFIDKLGNESKTECLCDGQQFVSNAIHPDTGLAYLWELGFGPQDTHIDDLPTLTEEQAREIVAEFERWMTAKGCKTKGVSMTTPADVRRYQISDDDDELGLSWDQLGWDHEKLAFMVQSVPNDDDVYYGEDYNTARLGWLMFLMAIHHESGGSEYGRALAYEWSCQAPKHTDEKFDVTWASLGKNDKKPITARYIAKWANFFRRQQSTEQLADVLLHMDTATNLGELRTVIEDARKLVLDPFDRNRVSSTLQRNFRRFGTSLGVKEMRTLLRPPLDGTPDWLQGWVYLSHADRFFNINHKEMLTEKAFDNNFCEFIDSPAEFALREVKIDRAYMAGYLPTAGKTFVLNGHKFFNTYNETNIPKVPPRLEGEDRENVERVNAHFRLLFPIEREREIAKSWFAYIVQTRQRPNWALLMQGVDGDGRTFFGNMMAAVLGGENARTINGSDLEDRFTSWAVGQLFTLIEEVRIVGHNRYDILNKMKPYVTNTTIPVREPYIGVYNAPNTTAYMLTTNFQNALPITDADRRYFILLSQWQDTKHIKQLTEEGYFGKLYNTLQSSGALRGWLLAYKLHPEFNPLGRAPESTGRQSMIDQNKSDEAVALDDLIESGFYHEISEDVVVVSKLAEILTLKFGFSTPIKETSCAAILRMGGFNYIGRVFYEGKKVSVWSRNPRKFSRGTVSATIQVANYLKTPL